MFDKIFDTRFASAVKYPAEEVQAWPRPVHIPFFQFDLHPVSLCTNYHYPTDIHDEERLLFFKTQTYFEGEIKEVELYTTKLSHGKQRTAVIKYDSGKNYIIREFSNGTLSVRKAVG